APGAGKAAGQQRQRGARRRPQRAGQAFRRQRLRHQQARLGRLVRPQPVSPVSETSSAGSPTVKGREELLDWPQKRQSTKGTSTKAPRVDSFRVFVFSWLTLSL